MTQTKSGEDLEPVRGSKGTPFARRLFGAFGIGLGDAPDAAGRERLRTR